MLTSEGKELIEKMQPVWELMSKILGDIADNENNLLKAIDEAEEKIANQSFYQRALQLKKFKINNTISGFKLEVTSNFH